MNKNIKTKRVYDKYNKQDGARILVDRLWPRGIKKENAHIDEWIKDIAPSNDLRKSFSHKPDRWDDFKKKYFEELKPYKALCSQLLSKGSKNITLVYSAKDEEHNNAVALKEFLEEKF